MTSHERQRGAVVLAAVARALASVDATPKEALCALLGLAVPWAGRCGLTVEEFARMARDIAQDGARGQADA